MNLKKLIIAGSTATLMLTVANAAMAEEGCGPLFNGKCFEKLPPGDPVCLELMGDEAGTVICFGEVGPGGGGTPVLMSMKDVVRINSGTPGAKPVYALKKDVKKLPVRATPKKNTLNKKGK